MDVETYIEFIHEQCILAMYKEGREPYIVLREEMKRSFMKYCGVKLNEYK